MATSISAKHRYREAMEQVHSYNSKLLLDRRLRMPYIDNQTGLAQQDCHLWVSRVQRCAPMRKGQIYSYPSRRWMVRKRPDFVGSSKVAVEKKAVAEVKVEDNNNNNQDSVNENESKSSDAIIKTEDNSTIVEAPVPMSAAYVEEFYDDEPFDSELDSDEEFGSRKKKRKTARNNRKNKMNTNYNSNSMAFKFGAGDHKWKVGKVGVEDTSKSNVVEEKKKFYDCQFCSKRYKNQQSLRYHYEHHNHNLPSGEQQPSSNNSSTSASSSVPTSTTTSTSSASEQSEVSSKPANDHPPPNHVTGAKRKKGMPPSSFCDFCLGNANIVTKSGSSEELISCADCGRSGHPSCLQFNNKLTEQVKKYKWQCIECKSCCICGTSDNDEQLLFCDDCDRGYHMYCLTPPIAEPPEGSWQCQLCEARVKGKDISKVAVLPQHMDISFGQSAIKSKSADSVVPSTETDPSASALQADTTDVSTSEPTPMPKEADESQGETIAPVSIQQEQSEKDEPSSLATPISTSASLSGSSVETTTTTTTTSSSVSEPPTDSEVSTSA